MELKRLVRDDNGNVYATWVLTPDQFGFLLQHAITNLIEQGVARVADISEEELAKLKQEAESDYQTQILEAFDPTEIPQA